MFKLGQIVATPGALKIVQDPAELLKRHLSLDPGTLSEEDQALNAEAVKNGDRIFSSYLVNGTKVWVITEADRSSTCILLPEEY